ncbi:MAG: cyclic nucleotide-binding domain-containing protein [Chloroflexi bacterium]|nr:MAG: cyclic nucleotide-binding domain-containing protein [Chloroflexota bacterium]
MHFAGDTFLTIGTLVLITKFPRNPWLWIAVPFQIFHQAEHTFLMFNYVFEGAPQGGPGLLASPHGALDVPWYSSGGSGLNRPDLHWIYNTLYTIPFSLALVWQLKRTYDESLSVAFPMARRKDLVDVARRLETIKYPAHATILAEGDPAERLFIVAEGEVSVLQRNDKGEVAEVATLHKGQYFGEIGLLVPGGKHTATVRAKANTTVMCMDEETFRHLLSVSQDTKTGLDEVVRTRLQSLGGQTAPVEA